MVRCELMWIGIIGQLLRLLVFLRKCTSGLSFLCGFLRNTVPFYHEFSFKIFWSIVSL